MHIRFARHAVHRALLPSAILCALAAAPLLAQTQSDAKELETMVVTGSRIKRADIEGAMPVQVIDREAIDASGDISVAELLRDSTYASFGSLKPQSGSSAQGVASIDLRGLGAQRTLVLIDGRRAPKTPFTGVEADLNTVPLAAVERIEILSDGASAVYGSDAIGGVVNIILRKDFEGAELTYGRGDPAITGGDLESGSLMFGASSERGSLLAGASMNNRGMVFTRDQIGAVPGVSSFSNRYRLPGPDGAPAGAIINMPGFACNTNGFYLTVTGACSFDFNLVNANEASIKTSAVFSRGTYQINDDWSTYLNAMVARAQSFGRYAPVPGQLFVPSDSPNDPVPGDGLGAFVLHRYAAAGNRDNTDDSTSSDISWGFLGRLADRYDVEVAARRTEYQGYSLGRNYIVTPIAEQFAADGTYDLLDPFGNSQDVLNAIRATTARDTLWIGKEVFANASFDVFEMGGGTSSAVVGVEWRSEDYADIYDSLSSAGVIAGSAGNSAQGGRNIRSAYAEWLLPISSRFDITLAGRFDKYSDYGSDFAPKIAFRFQPFDALTLRGSYGEGFAAPSLPELTASAAFSADPAIDERTCIALGGNPATCGTTQIQVPATVIANPLLSSEQSKQYSIGAVWDALSWLNITADYYDTEITDLIRAFSAQDLIDRDRNPLLGGIPPGLGVTRDPVTGEITAVVRGSANEGLFETDGVDVNIRTDFDLGGWGALQNHLTVSMINNYDLNRTGNQTGVLGAPNLRAGLSNDWSLGNFSVAFNSNFIKGQSRDGAGLSVGGYTTHDLQVSWNAPWNARLTVGATNIGDKYPDLANYRSRPWNFYLYDAYGRTPYVRYTQTF